MCDCAKVLKSKIESEIGPGVIYVDVQEIEEYNSLKKIPKKTYSIVTAGINEFGSNKTKKKKFQLIHSFCPFCGQAYQQ